MFCSTTLNNKKIIPNTKQSFFFISFLVFRFYLFFVALYFTAISLRTNRINIYIWVKKHYIRKYIYITHTIYIFIPTHKTLHKTRRKKLNIIVKITFLSLIFNLFQIIFIVVRMVRRSKKKVPFISHSILYLPPSSVHSFLIVNSTHNHYTPYLYLVEKNKAICLQISFSTFFKVPTFTFF